MIAEAVIIETPVVQACERVSWPEVLDTHLASLPKRWLLRNERVSVILAGLGRGDLLALGPWPQACLLVLTFGELLVATSDNELLLHETDSIVIAPHAEHELRASGSADFLLMNLTPPDGWASRCLCHGAAGRKRILSTAAEMFGIHAQL